MGAKKATAKSNELYGAQVAMSDCNRKTTKIFIATPFESRMAGRGTRLPVLADMLVESGHSVKYVTSDFCHAQKRHFSSDEIAACVRKYNYETVVLKCMGYLRHISLIRILAHIEVSLRYLVYLWRTMGKGDLLVIPSRPPELLFAAALLKYCKGVRVHMDITDLWPDMLSEEHGISARLFGLYCRLLQYPSIRGFDSFTHISPCATNWLRRYAPNKTTCFVPLGFDAERWQVSTPEKAAASMIRVVYVGTMTYHFDLWPFLKSIVGRHDIEFTVVGQGGYVEKVAEFVAKNHMENVHLLGSINPEEVVEVLQGQHIGLSPEVSELSVIPNKVFDYIAAYCPVLVLGENDTARFVAEHGIGWALPFSEKRITQFLNELTHGQVQAKVSRLGEIRSTYSKRRLYKQFVGLLIKYDPDVDSNKI